MNPATRDSNFDNNWGNTYLDRQNITKRADVPVQTQQNTSALRQIVSPPLSSQEHHSQEQMQRLDHGLSQTDSNRAQRDMEMIRDLSAQMDRLRQEFSVHAQRVHNLELQLGKSEADCGQMLQDYMELGRAIELKRKHIRDDKTDLAQLQCLKEGTRERLDATFARISSLARGQEMTPNSKQ